MNWTLTYYVKADQGAWEHCYCVTQVLEPLYQVRDALPPHISDIAVQCRRDPGEYFLLEHSPQYGAHWVQTSCLFSGTRRFWMRSAPEMDRLVGLPDLNVDDAADYLAIADYVTWSTVQLPKDERTVLVFWGHGGGPQVPITDVSIIASLPQGAPVPPDKRPPWLSRNDMQKRDMTATRFHALPAFKLGLQDGLLKAKRDRIDVLAFNSCFMSCIEAAYEVRDLATVLVGSEESTPFDKWRHAAWIEWLAATPAATPEDVARQMVVTYEAKSRPECTLSAIRLGKSVKAVATAIKAFVDKALVMKDPAAWAALVQARAAVGSYGTYGGSMDMLTVDIQKWFGEAAKRLSGEMQQAARDVVTACANAIVYEDASEDRRGKWGSLGLSIFLPATRKDFSRLTLRERYDPANSQTPTFVKDTGWRTFLDKLWRHTPEAA